MKNKFNFLIEAGKLSSEEYLPYRFYPPISIEEINHFLKSANLEIPGSLKTFYQFSHGAQLSELHIFSFPEIVENIQAHKDTYSPDFRDTLLPFAEILGTGDFFCFDMGKPNEKEYPILDCFHEIGPDEWEEICFGLIPWLKAMIENNFDPYWL